MHNEESLYELNFNPLEFERFRKNEKVFIGCMNGI